ncbi:MAG: GntR family transcriptional regulator [Chloroflexota bacterium]
MAAAPQPSRTAAARRPVYLRIADDLRRDIAEGRLAPGAPLPTEQDLIERYGVSRGTVRQARSILRAEGAVGGSQGRVFSVRGEHLTQPLGELISFTRWTERLGRTPGAQVLHFGPEPASPAAAAALDDAPGVLVIRLERIRTLDGLPVMIERTVFPAAIGTLLEGVDLAHGSVYAALADRGVVVATARHRIAAIAAGAADAALLDLPEGAPLLRVERHGYDHDRRPLEWSFDDYRGDRADFAIENSAAAPVLARRLGEGEA